MRLFNTFALAVAFALAACATSAQSDDPPRARVQQGELAGRAADGVVSFKGVPFAAPPVGDLRWRAPQAPARWEGVRDARRAGPICVQPANPTDPGIRDQAQSEDCLTLSVWTPAERSGPLPVMVWIHGGGLTAGSHSAGAYDGANLAKQGVVVVGMNYRLGRLGFFALPALSREQAGQPLANYGLLDQIAALQWVRDNIAAFGGDPSNVTVFGESAGGISIQRLMISPLARGLFHKAIVQSGGGIERDVRLTETNGMNLPAAEISGAAFARALNASPDDLAALRALRATRIINEGPQPDIFEGFGTIIDGRVLTSDVYEAFRDKQEAQVPFLVGANELEFPNPAGSSQSLAFLGPARDLLKATYPSAEAFERHGFSDVIFGAPARGLAQLHAANGAPTYYYRFSVLTEAQRGRIPGAVHASEIPYVFNNMNRWAWRHDSNDAARAAEISAYWVQFAKTGDPNGGGRPNWPRYDAQTDMLLHFKNEGPIAERTPDAAPLSAIMFGRQAPQ